jgi:hypothetical protein
MAEVLNVKKDQLAKSYSDRNLLRDYRYLEENLFRPYTISRPLYKKTEEIFNKIKDIKEFDVVFDKLKNSKSNALFLWVMGQDKLTLFKLLFKFELFHITHSVLCSYFNNNTLSLSKLEEAIV